MTISVVPTPIGSTNGFLNPNFRLSSIFRDWKPFQLDSIISVLLNFLSFNSNWQITVN